MKRIYISGPMTGLPDLNVQAFATAADKLRAFGHYAVNPVEVCAGLDGSWHDYMRADIKALCDCDALALLPGWQTSQGAHLELHLAHRLGLEIGSVDEFTSACSFSGGNEPCPACPRKITALHACKLLQDEFSSAHLCAASA